MYLYYLYYIGEALKKMLSRQCVEKGAISLTR